MTKYIIGENFSSSGATLHKNPSDQTVTIILHYFPISRALCDIILAPPFHQAVSKGHDPANKTIFAVACVKSIITLLVPSRQRIWSLYQVTQNLGLGQS